MRQVGCSVGGRVYPEPVTTSALTAEAKSADGPIYHYTDPAGMLGIITGRVLWATEASGMNDLAEIRQGWEFIRKWLATQSQDDDVLSDMRDVARAGPEEMWYGTAPSVDNVFVLCATQAGDDANQWRLYGGAS